MEEWVKYWEWEIFQMHEKLDAQLSRDPHFLGCIAPLVRARACVCMCLSDSNMKAPTVRLAKNRPEKALFVCALFNRQASSTK